ncbi:MAG: DUF5615 family PIN-like protein [Dehalococcoidia bacterium]
MNLAFYFDDNIAAKPVISALRMAGVSATTADESANRGKPDSEHLEFAAEHGLALVTADEGDFSKLHWEWLAMGRTHAGIVLVRQRTSIGDLIRALQRLHAARKAEMARNELIYLSRY